MGLARLLSSGTNVLQAVSPKLPNRSPKLEQGYPSLYCKKCSLFWRHKAVRVVQMAYAMPPKRLAMRLQRLSNML